MEIETIVVTWTLRNNAYLCLSTENGAVDFNIFFSYPKMSIWYSDNSKQDGKKCYAF